MRSRSEVVSSILELGLVAIIRTSKTEQVLPVCEAILAGGLTCMEVTLTVPNATEAIRQVRNKFGDRILLGAGTVLTPAHCQAALEAGAEFIVTPITRLDLVPAAHAGHAPIMLGAYTPTEAQTAHDAGADFIKIFPADKLGPGYIKNLRAPLPHLRLVPTGGVDLQTAPEFLKAGSAALGVGSSLVTADILKAQNWPELTRLAGEYVRVVQTARARLSA